MNKLYMSKENRDKAWKQLPPEVRAKCRRTHVKNQLLHPQYVEDYEQETGHKLTPQEKGFGNVIYKTHFAVLYEIVEKR